MAAATRGSTGVVAAWSRYTGLNMPPPSAAHAESRAFAPAAVVALPLRRLTSAALHRTQYAAQDIELVAVELSAIEQSTQALHEVPGTVVKIDFVENLVQVRVKMLDIARRSQRQFQLGVRLRLFARHENFVGQELHRHRQIKRAILGIGGNAHQHIAMVQVLRGEAIALRAKQQSRPIPFRQTG